MAHDDSFRQINHLVQICLEIQNTTFFSREVSESKCTSLHKFGHKLLICYYSGDLYWPSANKSHQSGEDDDRIFNCSLTVWKFSKRKLMINNGITATKSLVRLTSKDIENVVTIVCKSVPPIVVNYVSQKRLTIMAYWTNWCHRLAESIKDGLFT